MGKDALYQSTQQQKNVKKRAFKYFSTHDRGPRTQKYHTFSLASPQKMPGQSTSVLSSGFGQQEVAFVHGITNSYT